jgi:hypothetical protein
MNCLSLYERLYSECFGDTPAIPPIELEAAQAFLKALIYSRSLERAKAQMLANPKGTQGLLVALRLQVVRGALVRMEPLSEQQYNRACNKRMPFADCYGQFLEALEAAGSWCGNDPRSKG